MSFLLAAKRRLCSPIFARLPRRFSSPPTQNPDLKTPPFMVVDYLISIFGISPAKAATISKPIAHLCSPQNPDAVRSFLRRHGFDDSQIKTIVTERPTILCSSPENTLGPNLLALRDMGLSAPALTQIILSGPAALQFDSAVHRIQFWKDFVGGEAALVKTFKLNRGLVGHDINGGIAKKISLLQSHGISAHNIRRIVCTATKFLTSSVTRIDDLLNRTKELGFQPESGMFAQGLQAMKGLSKEVLQKKMEFLKGLGLSDEQLLSALQKNPNMLRFSEENLQAKMDFLLGEIKFDISYITYRPVLLTYCLETRLRPRYHILRLLESKGVSGKTKDFYTAIILSDSKFMARYILPHKEEIPELHEVYLAACASGSGYTI